jgi:hypothetical protein
MVRSLQIWTVYVVKQHAFSRLLLLLLEKLGLSRSSKLKIEYHDITYWLKPVSVPVLLISCKRNSNLNHGAGMTSSGLTKISIELQAAKKTFNTELEWIIELGHVLKLWKQNAKLLVSKLKQWHLLAKGTRISIVRKIKWNCQHFMVCRTLLLCALTLKFWW